MPYSYTNRQGKTHYFREVQTKTGKYRYYVTTSNQYPNLIEEVPTAYEVVEIPEDARVIIRKTKPIWTTYQEREIVHDVIEELSAIKDFFIHAELDYIYVYHSQFNSTGGQEENLTRQQAIENYGEDIKRWMRFFTSMSFRLVDKQKRLFQAERVVFSGIMHRNFHPVGDIGTIEEVTRKYGQHLGKDSFFDIIPHGFGEGF